ncbi:MAG TPA: MgtC/SapB family protein [Thermoanaerobaculia bacterium]|nr:MgtC/SapB family protein [Thermoanaerobaculia bacterium]
MPSQTGSSQDGARSYEPRHPCSPQPSSNFAVALGLGLLVGLQRERMDSAIAGIRTFALITLFGTVAGQLGRVFGG